MTDRCLHRLCFMHAYTRQLQWLHFYCVIQLPSIMNLPHYPLEKVSSTGKGSLYDAYHILDRMTMTSVWIAYLVLYPNTIYFLRLAFYIPKTYLFSYGYRYLSFFHAVPVEIFSASDYRRKEYGSLPDAAWFDPVNAEAQNIRMKCNMNALNDAVQFLNGSQNGVAILDSTNPTHERRLLIKNTMLQNKVIAS